MLKVFSNVRLFSQIILRAAACLVALFIFTAAAASAATYTVDTTADDAALSACTDATPGDCSLRGAIKKANDSVNSPGADTINFDPAVFSTAKTITLVSGEIAINSDLTINGSGASAAITVSGNNSNRIFYISSGTVTLSSLTISGGNEKGLSGGNSGYGGGVYIIGGTTTLTVDNCIVSGNTAVYDGAGIYNTGGTVTVTGSTISGNFSYGNSGGIHNSAGTLKVLNSTISGNTANNTSEPSGGGGISNYNGGILTVTNSTISSNNSGRYGGGIYNNSGTVTMTNSTVSGNHANDYRGGGIYNGGTLNVTSSTIFGNSAFSNGGGISNSGAGSTVNLSDSIVAGNSAGSGPDIYGTVASGDYNLVQNTAGATLSGSHNITGLDPQLDTLKNNGGPTATMALKAGSYAINTGDPNFDTTAIPYDQRGPGFPRKISSAVDIGAYESSFTSHALLASNASFAGPRNAAFSGQLMVSGGDPGSTLTYSIVSGTLPAGLTLDSATGIISGTPTAYGSSTLTYNVTDNNGGVSNTATITFNITEMLSLVVNTTSDTTANDELTSLREAVAYANSGNAGANPIITFSVTGAITLTNGVVAINRNLTIAGPGRSSLTINGNNPTSGTSSISPTSIFNVSSGSVVFSGLTFSRGTGSFISNSQTAGGAIFISGGTVTVSGSTLSNNNANYGGAIYINGGSLTVADSTISNNNLSATNYGGGIYEAGGSVTITNSTVSGNTAGDGAGIYSGGGTLNIKNSTISGNTAQNYTQPNTFYCNYPACPNPPPPGYTCSGVQCTGYDSNNGRGGGIYNAGGTVFVTNSTISGNKALGYSTLIDYGGGGIDNRSMLTIANSTITNNTGQYGGGIQNRGPLNLSNSIVAGNSSFTNSPYGGAGPDIYNYPGGVTSGNYNLVQNGDTITGTNNITGQDPKLGPLQNNGGPTQTHALLAGSPAIDAGDPSFDASALPYDQRGPGFPRVQNGRVDIGAFEGDVYQSGSNFIVNTLEDHDDGDCGATDCTLREAVNYAPTGSTITFNVTGTIKLTNGNIITAKNLTINGPTSSPGITVSGNNASRIFTVTSGGALNLSTLTLSGGNGVGGGVNSGNGGALAIDPNATATVTNCTFSGNNAPGGTGGAIRSGGTVTVTNSIFSGNTAGAGGAIRNNGTLTVTSSTFSGNSSTAGGGGIYNNSKATLTNSTVSGNTAGTDGGGIIISGAAAQLTLTSVTVAFNTATSGSGGGVNNINGTATLRNTLVAKNNNSTAPDFSGAIASTSSFNLIGDGTGMTGITGIATNSSTSSLMVDSNGNQVGASGSPIDPKLDPTLALNGGTTPNHALLLNSPAIDQGSDTSGTDQRGFTRPVDLDSYANSTATGANAADIGAYEAQTAPLAPTAATVSISGQVTTPSGRGIMNVRLSLTDSEGDVRTVTTTSFGYYQFTDVEVGKTYILAAAGKHFTFNQPVQVLNVSEEINQVNFIADSEKRSRNF